MNSSCWAEAANHGGAPLSSSLALSSSFLLTTLLLQELPSNLSQIKIKQKTHHDPLKSSSSDQIQFGELLLLLLLCWSLHSATYWTGVNQLHVREPFLNFWMWKKKKKDFSHESLDEKRKHKKIYTENFFGPFFIIVTVIIIFDAINWFYWGFNVFTSRLCNQPPGGDLSASLAAHDSLTEQNNCDIIWVLTHVIELWVDVSFYCRLLFFLSRDSRLTWAQILPLFKIQFKPDREEACIVTAPPPGRFTHHAEN